jgi:hypothetical protein
VSYRETRLYGVPAGELGWEMFVKMEDMERLYSSLLASGADLQLEHFGSRVINTLRIEKGKLLSPCRSRLCLALIFT